MSAWLVPSQSDYMVFQQSILMQTGLIRYLGNTLTQLGNRGQNKDEKWKTLVQHSKVNYSRIILNAYKNKFVLAGE